VIDGKHIHPDDKRYGEISQIKINFTTGAITLAKEEVIS
jgi:hypothetical protein